MTDSNVTRPKSGEYDFVEFVASRVMIDYPEATDYDLKLYAIEKLQNVLIFSGGSLSDNQVANIADKINRLNEEIKELGRK